MQTHYHDIAYAWVRSYDSYYGDIEYVCDHTHGEWSIMKEATSEDYGVQMKTCTRCGESLYEVLPKTVTEEGDPEKDSTNFPASLFGNGSVAVIIFASVAMVAVGVAVYFYIRFKKATSDSQKDDE